MNRATLMLLPLALTGCDAASEWVDRKLHDQTTLGYSYCLEKNENAGISETTLRRLCIDKHERRVRADIDARAAYNCSYGSCSFEGFILNKSDKFVITRLEIAIFHEDNVNDDGEIIPDIASSPQLWVEPNHNESILFQDVDFQPMNRPGFRGGSLV